MTQHEYRKIRSYVRREGRFTPAQRAAFESLWPRYGVDADGSAPFAFTRLFGRDAPVYLELGFGDGQVIRELARRNPGNDYLGVEVHRPGVGRLMRELDEEGLENVRVACTDGSELLRDRVPAASLAGIMIFFPDPWHKKKHHKRRLVQPDFIRVVATKLQAGGIIHLATDWEDYALQMLEVLSAEPLLGNTSPDGGFIERPDSRPLSKYEQRGIRLGHGAWDLAFRRRDD